MTHAVPNRATAERAAARAAPARSVDGSESSEGRNALGAARRLSGLVRADGRPADVVAFEESLVDFFVEAADILGVPKSVAAIYAICFASTEPVSFSDINERLEISSGSISQGLRVLKEVGALRVAHPMRSVEPSSNQLTGEYRTDASAMKQMLARSRERYEPDLELRKIVTHFLENRLAKQLHSGHSRLKAIAKIVPPKTTSSAKVLKSRLKALQTWHDKTRALLPIAKTFLKLT